MGDEVVVLHGQKEEEEKEEDIRFYIMYIIYDEYYYTPRMFFSATDIDGKPIDNERIKEDIQKEYLDKTLTIEPLPLL
jgi:ubiquitin-like-conjugating enzyme ATG3